MAINLNLSRMKNLLSKINLFSKRTHPYFDIHKKPEKGPVKINREAVNIEELMNEVTSQFESHVIIKRDYLFKSPTFYLDREQLSMALYLILKSFTSENLTAYNIFIRLINTSDYVSISIMTEDGPPEEGKHFYEDDEKINKAGELIEKHNGQLVIRNKEFITVYIPNKLSKERRMVEGSRIDRSFSSFIKMGFDFFKYLIRKFFLI